MKHLIHRVDQQPSAIDNPMDKVTKGKRSTLTDDKREKDKIRIDQ